MKEKQIEVLKQTELCGRQFEVYGTPQEPLFKAQDVADMIKHSNVSKMLALVDDDEKGVNQLLTPGGYQQVWFLTEDGLYEVLMQSRKPIAKQFKKGVKSILKEIRANGGYIATREDETPEVFSYPLADSEFLRMFAVSNFTRATVKALKPRLRAIFLVASTKSNIWCSYPCVLAVMAHNLISWSLTTGKANTFFLFKNMSKNTSQIYQYNGSPITFQAGDSVMVNATQMAKPFGKHPAHFLRTSQTEDYLKTLSVVRKITTADLVRVTQGGDPKLQGTWLHEDETPEVFSYPLADSDFLRMFAVFTFREAEKPLATSRRYFCTPTEKIFRYRTPVRSVNAPAASRGVNDGTGDTVFYCQNLS